MCELTMRCSLLCTYQLVTSNTDLLGFSERFASVFGASSQLFFDAENLIVFGQTFGAAGSTGLDLTSGQANNQVGNEGILSLTGTMGDHGAPAILFGQQMGLNGLGDGADLVDLQQQAVAGLLLNGSLDTLGIGDSQIIADNLNGGVGGDIGPGIPMILVEGIFNGHNGEVLDEFLIHFSQFGGEQAIGLCRCWGS